MRAWRLSRRNIFRLAVVFVLTVGPIWAFAWLATIAILGTDFPQFPEWQWQVHEFALAVSAYFEWWDHVLTLMAAHPVERFAVEFFTTVVEYALTAGVIGSAYLQLTGPQA